MKVLKIEENILKKLPKSLESLPNLENLNISENKLEHLEIDLRNLYKLKFLKINSNKLEQYPPVTQCKELKAF